MISYSELKKGVKIILDKQPYEILEANPMKKAQRRPVIQSKLKNLVSGGVVNRNFHQGESFKEADLSEFSVKFLYSNRDRYFFCEEKNPGKRFDLGSEQLGNQAKYLKSDQVVKAMVFDENVINISLPIKIQLKVVEAPPGIRGDRAQGGTKIVVLETNAKIAVPLFIESGDTIEINTQSDEYVKRV